MLLALSLAGCWEPCPDYGPYALWTDKDLHTHLAGLAAGSRDFRGTKLASSDPAVTAHAYIDTGPGGLGQVDAFEVTALWGPAEMYELRKDLGGGRSLLLHARSLGLSPVPGSVSVGEARAFLGAVMDEPPAILDDWSRRLAELKWLELCEAPSCGRYGIERSTWNLRLDDFIVEQRPWMAVPAGPWMPDEAHGSTGYEAQAAVTSGPWTLGLSLSQVNVEGFVGDQPFTLRVAADGVSEFNLRNQPWGERQEPRPRLAQLEPALTRVLGALGWEAPPGPDLRTSAGNFGIGCIY